MKVYKLAFNGKAVWQEVKYKNKEGKVVIRNHRNDVGNLNNKNYSRHTTKHDNVSLSEVKSESSDCAPFFIDKFFFHRKVFVDEDKKLVLREDFKFLSDGNGKKGKKTEKKNYGTLSWVENI